MAMNPLLDFAASFILIIMSLLVGNAARPDFNGICTIAVFDAFIIWRIFV